MFKAARYLSRSLVFYRHVARIEAPMMPDIAIQTFWEKALENIDSAASEFSNRRYNASANRAYYACFQAAIVALMRGGVRPPGSQWGRSFVQPQFAGQLVSKRKMYPS